MLSATSAAPAQPVMTDNKETAGPAKWSEGSIRILHVLPQLAIGGTELALARVVKSLSADAFSHRVCAMKGCVNPESWQSELGSEPIVVAEGGGGFNFPVRQMVRMMRELKPDVVHTRNWGALEAVLAARIAGVPAIIHSEHGYDPAMLNGLPARRRVFRRSMYALVDKLMAVTSELAEYHAEQAWISPKRFGVIYNGIDLQKLRPSADGRSRVRNEFSVGDQDLVVGWMGRMAPIKDVPTLLRAVAKLATAFANVRVLLVGSGPEESKWRDVAQSIPELNGRVIFAGERRDVADVLGAMDLFVLPSIREGMSNTLLEAMSLSLPVVASAAGGNSEVVEDKVSGFLFQAGDDARLADLLKSLLANAELRARMGAAARQRVEANFSMQKMTQNYSDLYAGVAKRRPELKHVRN